MRIRAFSCFYNPGASYADQTLEKLGELARQAIKDFNQAGYEVQTARLATTPFATLCPSGCLDSGVTLAKTLEAKAKEQGFSYLSLGPALPEQLESYPLIPKMLAATENVFFDGIMTTSRGEISLPAIKACAQVIHENAAIRPNGFANLNFGALANVPPFTPFYPAAYSFGNRPAFALAIEGADLAVTAFSDAKSLSEARQLLLESLHQHTQKLAVLCNSLANQFKIDFKGFDCSLAPFPEEWCSIGHALEALGIPALGQAGSLAMAAFLADTLDQGQWLRTGFNGLMLPVLEDATLAERSGNSLTLKDMLLFSTVCGTGLDTIPLPGDASEEQLAAVLLDVAALALRLNKPLTARLMPVPGKKAGEMTEFQFDYFCNGKVMELSASPLQHLLDTQETFKISPRPQR
jgi:uncharacterized protein (UPF0210 family)